MKTVFATLALAGLMATASFAQPAKPKSVIHIINVSFDANTPKADVDRAVQAAGEINHPGLKNVWLRPIKNQLDGVTHIIVMEFESEAALKSYAGSPAQKKWYEAYQKAKPSSRTNDVTN